MFHLLKHTWGASHVGLEIIPTSTTPECTTPRFLQLLPLTRIPLRGGLLAFLLYMHVCVCVCVCVCIHTHTQSLFSGTTAEQIGLLRMALSSRKFAGLTIGRVGGAVKTMAQFHITVAHLAVDRRGRVTGAQTRESAISAISHKCRLLVDLGPTSWRGWAGFLPGRVQFVGMSARQVRACTAHGRVRHPSPADLHDSYTACMHDAAVWGSRPSHQRVVGGLRSFTITRLCLYLLCVYMHTHAHIHRHLSLARFSDVQRAGCIKLLFRD